MASDDSAKSWAGASRSPYLAFLDNPNQLEVIDQRKLPQAEVKVRLRTVEDVKKAIEFMIVRGAPVSIAGEPPVQPFPCDGNATTSVIC